MACGEMNITDMVDMAPPCAANASCAANAPAASAHTTCQQYNVMNNGKTCTSAWGALCGLVLQGDFVQLVPVEDGLAKPAAHDALQGTCSCVIASPRPAPHAALFATH